MPAGIDLHASDATKRRPARPTCRNKIIPSPYSSLTRGDGIRGNPRYRRSTTISEQLRGDAELPVSGGDEPTRSPREARG